MVLTGQVILASDTVYPGNPLSDAKAFFDLVSIFLVSITAASLFATDLYLLAIDMRILCFVGRSMQV